MTCCHPEREVLPQPEVTGLIQKTVGEIFDMHATMKESWVIVVILSCIKVYEIPTVTA